MLREIRTIGYAKISENGDFIQYDLNDNIISKGNFNDLKNEAINKKYKEVMTLDELENAYVLYDSYEYNEFLEKFEKPIENLSYEDKMDLYKELYTGSDECNEDIADLLQGEVLKNGVSEREIKNIAENIKFDSNGYVAVFRGINRYNDYMYGSSYTLSEEKAKWFSTKFGDEEDVISIRVKLEDIIFYDNSREEQEVFITDEAVSLNI